MSHQGKSTFNTQYSPMPTTTRSKRPSRSVAFPLPEGTRIRVIARFDRHNYLPNETYTVVRVDANDQTLVAKDDFGEEGHWIRWSDCAQHAEIGWEWLKTKLPAEALDLLSAFDGLESLSLREDIRNHLITKMPDLKNRVLGALEEQEVQMTQKMTQKQTKTDQSLSLASIL